MVNIRWRDHSVRRQVERPNQVMNVNKRVEFSHFFWLNNVTADSQYSVVKKTWMNARHKDKTVKQVLCQQQPKCLCSERQDLNQKFVPGLKNWCWLEITCAASQSLSSFASMTEDSLSLCAKLPLPHRLKAVNDTKGICIKYWIELKAYLNRDARRFREMRRSWFWARHREPVFTYPETHNEDATPYISWLSSSETTQGKMIAQIKVIGGILTQAMKTLKRTLSGMPRHIKQYLSCITLKMASMKYNGMAAPCLYPLRRYIFKW